MAQNSISKSLQEPFHPPFKGLAAVLWVFFVCCFLVFPNSSILRGDLPDTDDYTYMTQILDWLQGQSWFDNVQHRMSPPEGVSIHFTRLHELPIALLVLAVKGLGASWIGAATVAAVIYPTVLLVGFFFIARWVGEAFLPREWARVTAFPMFFGVALMAQFAPGHVDHHAMTAMIVFAAFGCLARLFDDPSRVRMAAVAGGLLSLGLAVALETLPWVVLLTGVVGLWALVKGRVGASAGLAFAASLHVGSILFLILCKRPADWFVIDVLAYSVVYVFFTGCMATSCAVVSLVGMWRWPLWARTSLSVALASVLGGVFFLHFPELLVGPYGAMDPELARAMLANISEAQPMVMADKLPFMVAGVYAFAEMTSFIIAFGKFTRATGGQKWSWGLLAALVLASTVLGCFYQVRLMRYAATFTIIPLSVLLYEGWTEIGQSLKGRMRFWAELGLLLLVGPFPAVLLPALVDNRPFNTGVLLFPARNTSPQCNMDVLAQVLRMPQPYGSRPLTIMNMIDQGPELLFRTPHRIMSAPYHTNVKGTLDSIHFYKTPDPEVAKKIMEKDGVDLVVMCRHLSSLYTKTETGGPVVIADKTRDSDVPKDATFAEQLIRGKTPEWLRVVNYPLLGDFIILESTKSFPQDIPPHSGKDVKMDPKNKVVK